MKLNKIMLRSLLLVICGALIAPSAWAQFDNPGIAEQKEIRLTSYLKVDGSNSFKVIQATKSGTTTTTFEAMKDASLAFTITQSVQSPNDQSISNPPLSSDATITLGVYTYTVDENGNINITGWAKFEELGEGSEVNTAGVLDIKAGDMVGMYVQREGSTSAIETSYLTPGAGLGELPESTVQMGKYRQEGRDGSPTGFAGFEMHEGTSWPGKWPDDLAHVDVLVNIAAAPPASGAPLPGVVATVMLCGAVGGYFNRRKKGASSLE